VNRSIRRLYLTLAGGFGLLVLIFGSWWGFKFSDEGRAGAGGDSPHVHAAGDPQPLPDGKDWREGWQSDC